MEQYILTDEKQLSPVVVLTTLLLVLAFAIGIGYQLVGLAL